MRECQHGSIQIDWETLAFRLVKFFIGSEAEFHLKIGLHIILYLFTVSIDKSDTVGRHLLYLVTNTQTE